MELQRLYTRYVDEAEIQQLYYGCDNRIFKHTGAGEGISLEKDAAVQFGTFFNCFSIGKWKKYTSVENLKVCVRGKGKATVTLMHMYFENESLRSDIIEQAEGKLEDTISVDIPKELDGGIVFPIVRAEEKIVIEGGGYFGDSEFVNDDIRLAIDICTFKREKYVKRNIDNIREKLLDNSDSPLFGKLKVFISDNAKTLGDTFDSYENVKVMPNKNVGGVGGFTRGIIEALKDESISHVLIMDDDAVIETASVEKTYNFLRFLKPEFKDYTIGGSLLRENTPNIQYESGAVWDRGSIVALKHHMDMNTWACLIRNEIEERTEYAGWWYCCVPVSQIKKEGLPLPLFIHRDDIEYGIRTGKGRFIFLNGIAVWHEAFENKMGGTNEYYDLRNMAIINSIHYSDYSKKELKKFLFKWVITNILRYRYAYVDMNMRGIEDFLKGFDWFKQQDGEALHKEIMKMNYKSVPAKQYANHNNLKAEDLSWEKIEKIEHEKPGKFTKYKKLVSFNGLFLKNDGKSAVSMPQGNVYDLYRKREVIYVDSSENAFLLKRNRKQAKLCYKKYKAMKKEIDRKFETAKNSYRESYKILQTEEFWKNYLDID